MVADPDTDSTERYSRQSIDRCQPPTHQHKALGTNESVRGFCYFLDMFYMWLLKSKWVPIFMGCLFCVCAYYPDFTVSQHLKSF